MTDDLPARGRILAAAERLFAERGFDHTSTALVAAEARVPQGLIFYHFKTKMELLLAVIREDQASLLDGLLPALPPGRRSGRRPAPGRRRVVAAPVRRARRALPRSQDHHPGARRPSGDPPARPGTARADGRQRGLLPRPGQPAPGRAGARAPGRRPAAHHRRRDGAAAGRAQPHADPARGPGRPDQRRPAPGR